MSSSSNFLIAFAITRYCANVGIFFTLSGLTSIFLSPIVSILFSLDQTVLSYPTFGKSKIGICFWIITSSEIFFIIFLIFIFFFLFFFIFIFLFFIYIFLNIFYFNSY